VFLDLGDDRCTATDAFGRDSRLDAAKEFFDGRIGESSRSATRAGPLGAPSLYKRAYRSCFTRESSAAFARR
jgi:hypothetical protein